MFDLERFLAACGRASGAADPVRAVEDTVRHAVQDPAAVRSALGPPTGIGQTTYLSTPTLTVQRITWGPGVRAEPHEHRMAVVTGVFASIEENRLYRLDEAVLAEADRLVLEPGSVLVLPADAVHDVFSPAPGWTDAFHVYLGDIAAVERRAWDRAGRARPFDSEAVHAAVVAYTEGVRRLGRLPTATEGEQLIRSTGYGS